jgi:hypothetical protein
MLRRVREQTGTAGLVMAVVALVAALGGVAFAAKGALTSKQKKEVRAIAKSYQGTGAQGSPGKDGATGAQGPAGEAGKNGQAGSSVTVVPVPGGELECEGRGGAILEDEQAPSGVAEVCTGEQGVAGPEGQFGGAALKSEKTEKGAWAVTGSNDDTEGVITAISFPQPLAATIPGTSEKFHIFTDSDFATFCEGNAGAPTAKSGELCVYGAEGTGSHVTKAEIWQLSNASKGASKAGALLVLEFSSPGVAVGGWAVTG